MPKHNIIEGGDHAMSDSIYPNPDENQDNLGLRLRIEDPKLRRRHEYESGVKELEALPGFVRIMKRLPTEDEYFDQYDRWQYQLLVNRCMEINGIGILDLDTRKLEDDFKTAKAASPTLDYKNFCDTYKPTLVKRYFPAPKTGESTRYIPKVDVLTRWEGDGRDDTPQPPPPPTTSSQPAKPSDPSGQPAPPPQPGAAPPKAAVASQAQEGPLAAPPG